MNINTGEVKQFGSIDEAMTAGFTEQVSISEMTKRQEERFMTDEQPVVSLNDNRSKLGKKRIKEKNQSEFKIGEHIDFGKGQHAILVSSGKSHLRIKTVGFGLNPDSVGKLIQINHVDYQIVSVGKISVLKRKVECKKRSIKF